MKTLTPKVTEGIPLVFVLALLLISTANCLQAQSNNALSEAEVETLRDTADSPTARLQAFEQFINDREKALDAIVTGHHGAGYASDTHDLMQQIGDIADELNDNLDEWARAHRDLRKPLPKLSALTDRWSTALRAPARDDRYEIARRHALDAINDTHTTAAQMATDQATYFKDHPEAAAAEKRRAADPHKPE